MRDLRLKSLIATFVLASLWVVLGCGGTEPTRVSFTVEGMTCESCSTAITDALSKIDGVERAAADHVAGSAEATVLGGGIDPQQLADEIEGLGFTVTDVRTMPAGD